MKLISRIVVRCCILTNFDLPIRIVFRFDYWIRISKLNCWIAMSFCDTKCFSFLHSVYVWNKCVCLPYILRVLHYLLCDGYMLYYGINKPLYGVYLYIRIWFRLLNPLIFVRTLQLVDSVGVTVIISMKLIHGRKQFPWRILIRVQLRQLSL